MITLPKIWNSILTFLGFRDEPPEELGDLAMFATDYESKRGYNMAYIASNKIANLVTTDSQINVIAQTKGARIDFLQKVATQLWKQKKSIASRTAGYGKVFLFPYTTDGKTIRCNIVEQSKVLCLAKDSSMPTDIVVLADVQTVRHTTYHKYKRYTLDGMQHTIREFYANATTGVVLGEAPPSGTTWVQLEPFAIDHVDRLLFGSIATPIDQRAQSDFYGVSILDGCKDLIADIQEQFKYLAKEYKLKETFIGADEGLIRKDAAGNLQLPEKNVFRILQGDIDSFFQVFDPAIRFDPIYNRLKLSFEMLENQIGVSRGIFTTPESLGTYTNKSNIKRAVYDTYALVTGFRDNMLDGMKDYLYACNVLAEHFGMTPQGVSFDDVAVSIDWSNALIEDSAEEFNQYMEALTQGIVDKTETRQWLKSEDFETAAKKIAEMPEVADVYRQGI